MIPALNEEHCLPACLRSLAAQDFGGLVEVIVVDNGSTDRTAELAVSLGATVVVETTRGVTVARQAGTLAAVGEIVVSTDADTTFPAGWLTTIDGHFTDRAVTTVAGPPHFVGAPWWGRIYERLLFGLVHAVYVVTGYTWYVSAANVAFRREVFPGYDTRLTQGGDEWDLLRRLRPAGRVVFDLDNPTLTSSRRLQRGLAYNIAVTCLYYYVLGYVINRVSHRTVLGMAPSIREDGPPQRRPAGSLVRAAGTVVVAAVVLVAAVKLVSVA